MASEKPISYWKHAVGSMQLMELIRRLDREIRKVSAKPDRQRTQTESTYLSELYMRRKELEVQSLQHADTPHRRARWFDIFMIYIYRWSQGIPQGMFYKITEEDVKI